MPAEPGGRTKGQSEQNWAALRRQQGEGKNDVAVTSQVNSIPRRQQEVVDLPYPLLDTIVVRRTTMIREMPQNAERRCARTGTAEGSIGHVVGGSTTTESGDGNGERSSSSFAARRRRCHIVRGSTNDRRRRRGSNGASSLLLATLGAATLTMATSALWLVWTATTMTATTGGTEASSSAAWEEYFWAPPPVPSSSESSSIATIGYNSGRTDDDGDNDFRSSELVDIEQEGNLSGGERRHDAPGGTGDQVDPATTSSEKGVGQEQVIVDVSWSECESRYDTTSVHEGGGNDTHSSPNLLDSSSIQDEEETEEAERGGGGVVVKETKEEEEEQNRRRLIGALVVDARPPSSSFSASVFVGDDGSHRKVRGEGSGLPTHKVSENGQHLSMQLHSTNVALPDDKDNVFLLDGAGNVEADKDGTNSPRDGEGDDGPSHDARAKHTKKQHQDKMEVGPTVELHRNANATEFLGPFASIRSQLDYTYHSNYTPDRQILQDAIVQSFLRHSHVVDQVTGERCPRPSHPWIVFTAGAMGSGKTHTLRVLSRKGRFPLSSFVAVDPDEIRRHLPEFGRYVREYPNEAGEWTRKEAGYIAEVLTLAALQCGKNVLVDGSLRDDAWYRVYFDQLRRDYDPLRIAILHVTAPREVVFRRAEERSKITGRVVPQKTLELSLELVPQSVKVLGPLADYACEISNPDDGADDVELVTKGENWDSFTRIWSQSCAYGHVRGVRDR